MGFFSWDCKECGKSARCGMAVDGTANEFMKDVVVYFHNGLQIAGEYDGYGRISDYDESLWRHSDEPFTLYHRQSWEKAGRPEFKGASKDSNDQGWFFRDNGLETGLAVVSLVNDFHTHCEDADEK